MRKKQISNSGENFGYQIVQKCPNSLSGVKTKSIRIMTVPKRIVNENITLLKSAASGWSSRT